MKKGLVLSLLFTSLFILGGKNIEEDPNNKCSYEVHYNNTLLAEDDNKCFNFKEKEYKNLMIVAHPDDETIFGGGHLLSDDYTVVCVTCGQIEYRVNEFSEVMGKTNDNFIMLGFDDRMNKTGPISDWSYQYDAIYNKLSEIINATDWDTIVTHNPDGEYGHIHHQMLSEMVTNITNKENLYYFGNWYYNGDSNAERLPDDIYNTKVNDLIGVYYRSQGTALNYNQGMFPYENWIKATEW